MKALLSGLALLLCTGLAPAKVTVSGNGKVTYVPDVGYVTVGVVSEGKTAAEAWEKNRQKVEAVFEALTKLGLDPKDMQTAGLNVSPKYVRRPHQEPEFVGYTARYDLRLTVRRLPEMGKVLDSVVEAGANRRMNISFGSSEHEKLLDEARVRAVADARKKANLYANGAGARLGRVLTISEHAPASHRGFVYEHLAPASADKSLPIAAGEQELSVRVHLEYALLPESDAA